MVAAWNLSSLNAIPVIVALACFGIYVLIGNTLTASEAFTSLTLFNILRTPLFQLPQLVRLLFPAMYDASLLLSGSLEPCTWFCRLSRTLCSVQCFPL